MAAIINPYKNREKSTLAIKKGEQISRWVATFITGIGGAIWGYSTVITNLPTDWWGSPYLAVVAGIVVAWVLGWITDHAFGDFLQRVTTDIVAARHPDAVQWSGPEYFRKLRKAERVLFIVVLIALFAFDAFTTIIIRDPVADEAKKIELTDIAAATSTLTKEQKQAADPMAAQIAALKKEIASAEARAASSNPALAKLAQDGNGWAKQEIAKKRASASKSARSELEKLSAAYNTTLASQSTTLSETQSLINQQNHDAAQANARNRDVMASMYIWMAFGPKALAIILRILMVISFFAYSSGLKLDLNGDGIIDNTDVEIYYQNLLQQGRERKAAAAKAMAKTTPTDFDDVGTAFK